MRNSGNLAEKTQQKNIYEIFFSKMLVYAENVLLLHLKNHKYVFL